MIDADVRSRRYCDGRVNSRSRSMASEEGAVGASLHSGLHFIQDFTSGIHSRNLCTCICFDLKDSLLCHEESKTNMIRFSLPPTRDAVPPSHLQPQEADTHLEKQHSSERRHPPLLNGRHCQSSQFGISPKHQKDTHTNRLTICHQSLSPSFVPNPTAETLQQELTFDLQSATYH
jgi:hypothetical protein